jgi:hypothetical protein
MKQSITLGHSCGVEFKVDVHEKLWIEHQENMELIKSGRLNLVNCPNCGKEFHAPMPVLCTNVPAGYAVWYLPERSKMFLDYVEAYNRQLAPLGSFYKSPPQATTLTDLLQVISEFENGIRAKGSLVKNPLAATLGAGMQDKPKSSSGCALFVFASAGLSVALLSMNF